MALLRHQPTEHGVFDREDDEEPCKRDDVEREPQDLIDPVGLWVPVPQNVQRDAGESPDHECDNEGLVVQALVVFPFHVGPRSPNSRAIVNTLS